MKLSTISVSIILTCVFIATLSYADITKNAMVEKNCTPCHQSQRVYDARGTQQWWDDTVDRMKSNGAQLNADEEKEIKQFLYTLKK